MSEMITTGDKVASDIFDDVQKRRMFEKTSAQRIKDNWVYLRNKGFGRVGQGQHPPPAILDYDKGRMFHDVFPDGEWRGQRCFIIGGGESLKNFDFSKLKNELVIGVNLAFKKIDCQINFAMDYNLYEWIINGKLGATTKKKFEDYEGYPVWLDTVGYNYPKNIFVLPGSTEFGLSSSLSKGIVTCTNSGFGALNLAICLGADPIYLLGFDMKGKDGKQVHWHNGYPDRQGSKVYGAFINDFNRIAPTLKKRGTHIVNLNSESALKCFEFGKFKDVKPIDQPIITSYYTKETGYETQVEHLKATLRRFNLENDIVGIPDQGSWRKNVYYKAGFILKMMKKYPGRAIVFVDADAKIHKSPVLFNDYNCDFACHFFNKKELLSGTLYFGSTKGARLIVDEWIKENEAHPTIHMPQRNLHVVFNKQKNNIESKVLPVEYCMIFDSSVRHEVKPVIVHFQLSRLYKNYGTGRVKKRPGYRMKESFTEIQKFCKDKRICLLGNADSVLREKRNIDSFDVVCRCNRGKPEGKEKFLGNRTDILFLSTHMSGGNFHGSFNPQFAVWMTVCHRLASAWTLKNAYQNPAKDWNYLYKILGINPTTGMMALYFILKHIDFKSLTIHGFDFFATPTWYNTAVDSGQKHSGEKEKVIFMKMIEGKKNVRFI